MLFLEVRNLACIIPQHNIDIWNPGDTLLSAILEKILFLKNGSCLNK